MLKSVTVAGNQFGVFFIGRMQIAPLAAATVETAKPAVTEDPEAELPGDDNGGPMMFPPPGGQPDDQRGQQPGGAPPPDGKREE